MVTFLCPFIGCLHAGQRRGFPLVVCGSCWISVSVTKTNDGGAIIHRFNWDARDCVGQLIADFQYYSNYDKVSHEQKTIIAIYFN